MTVSKMHELFTIVLSRKDLSKAGDLFSVSDSEIVDDLADVVSAKFLKFFQFHFLLSRFFIQKYNCVFSLGFS